MDVVARLEAPYPPAAIFVWVDELNRYPQWLDIVTSAEAAPAHSAEADDAWLVDLRARLGPLARSKRLRMVRTQRQAPTWVRFERKELGGRAHSAWVLDASVEVVGDQSQLTMRLHYAGKLWAPMLERLLSEEIERSRTRLLGCLAGAATE